MSVGCQPGRVRSSTVQADLTVGSGRVEGPPNYREVQHGGQGQCHDFSNADHTD